MIDFQIQSRHSGKSSELIKMYKENPGIFFIKFIGSIAEYRKYKIEPISYSIKNLKSVNSIWFYFDDFCNQDYISFDDILELDQYNKNIVIRSSPGILHPPIYFLKYLKEYYPEYVI
jgi:hypothetical protein